MQNLNKYTLARLVSLFALFLCISLSVMPLTSSAADSEQDLINMPKSEDFEGVSGGGAPLTEAQIAANQAKEAEDDAKLEEARAKDAEKRGKELEESADDFNPDCKKNKGKGDIIKVSEYVNAAMGNKWWEKPYKIVSESTVKIGEAAYKSVAGATVSLLAVGFGLWLALFCLKTVGSLSEQDPYEAITKVIGMVFKGMFAWILIVNSDLFFTYAFIPIIEVGFGFAGSAVTTIPGANAIPAVVAGGLEGILPPLDALMLGMHQALAAGIGIGEAVMCYSYINTFGNLRYPDYDIYISGCLLKLGCWILLIAFPFRVFDALFRLGVTAALCPLLIAAWVFPLTAEFPKKGLSAVLHLTFLFLCLAIVLSLDVQLLLGTTGLADVGKIEDPIKLMTALGVSTEKASVLLIVVTIFFTVQFLMKADELANYFSGASFTNDTAFQAAQAGAGMVKTAAEGGGGFVASRVGKTLDRNAAQTEATKRQKQQSVTKKQDEWDKKNPNPKPSDLANRPKDYKPTKKEERANFWLKKRGVIGSNDADIRLDEVLKQTSWRRLRGAKDYYSDLVLNESGKTSSGKSKFISVRDRDALIK